MQAAPVATTAAQWLRGTQALDVLFGSDDETSVLPGIAVAKPLQPQPTTSGPSEARVAVAANRPYAKPLQPQPSTSGPSEARSFAVKSPQPYVPQQVVIHCAFAQASRPPPARHSIGQNTYSAPVHAPLHNVHVPLATPVAPPPRRYPLPHEAPRPVNPNVLRDRHSGDEEDEWKPYKVGIYPDNKWWLWGSGIIDLRGIILGLQPSMSEGTLLRKGFAGIKWVLRQQACEHKVGIARLLGVRWEHYQNQDARNWRPSHLFVLLKVQGRVAAGFTEAGLISMQLSLSTPADYNRNLENNDIGGTGPRRDEDMDAPYFIYLATKSLQ